MKLLHYTYHRFSLLFFCLMAVWGVLFYCTIIDEIVDETDDTLENYAHILIKSVLEDSTLLHSESTIMSSYVFRPISESEGRQYPMRFYDTTIYVEIEDEYEPARALQTSFCMPNGQYYELTLKISIVEREDMIEALFLYLGVLFLLLLLGTSLGVRLLLKRVFRPLNNLMEWLHTITPGKKTLPLNSPMKIREFRELTDAVMAMSNRSLQAYEEQKQFIENASHELQTPLAIATGKIELLAEGENLTEEQLKELDTLYATLGRAVKLNKSLLLLSRIENGQYTEVEKVNVDELIDKLLPDLVDIYEHKQIGLKREQGNAPFMINCNHTLAQVLLSNLLKNALLHNVEGGELSVITTSSSLQVRNSGTAPLDESRLFQRFYRAVDGKSESNGLGLSIAYSITRLSGLKLSYEWQEGMHCFSVVKELK